MEKTDPRMMEDEDKYRKYRLYRHMRRRLMSAERSSVWFRRQKVLNLPEVPIDRCFLNNLFVNEHNEIVATFHNGRGLYATMPIKGFSAESLDNIYVELINAMR